MPPITSSILTDLLFCIAIGYLFGSILPASIIGYFKKKNPFESGSGNPGMTNTIKTMGKSAGALVLLGDILKTLFAVVLCQFLFPAVRPVAALYTGFGCMLGHCYPFWHHFQGGKGVAVVCAAYILYAPIPGIIALACGGICLLLKKGVKVAAAAIPAVYLLLLLFQFTWMAFLPAMVMGIWMAYLNLRPNRLQDGKPLEKASLEKTVPSSAALPSTAVPSSAPASLASISSASKAAEQIPAED